MRRAIVLSTIALILTGCIPAKTPQEPTIRPPATSSSSLRQSEKEVESPRVAPISGTGALPERLLENGVLEIGNRDAPLSLLVITNHACRYCRNFHENHMDRLTEDFVRRGLLRIGIMTLPLKKYPQSRIAAALLLCAAQQGRGAAMHDSLFVSGGDRQIALQSAPRLGVDGNLVATCLDDAETSKVLAHHESWLRLLSVSLVPTFILNGDMRTGLMEYPELRGWIEKTAKEINL